MAQAKQSNTAKQSFKLDIFMANVINPHEFQFYYPATSDQCQQKKLNGSIVDISPAESVYNQTRLFDDKIPLKWTNDAIESFKNLVMARELSFEINIMKKDKTDCEAIYYGKLYLKLSVGDRDVSEIMVELGKAYNINATESSEQTGNQIMQLSVPEQKSKGKADLSSSGTIVERLPSNASDDSDWESKLMSAYSDDSVETEGICDQAAMKAPINNSANQSNISTIPAYLLEDQRSEIGAEKYSIPRNSDQFKDIDDDTAEMKKLLKNAKPMNDTFKLLFKSFSLRSRLMFNQRVYKYLQQMRSHDRNNIQERMWSMISKEVVKNIHIVGETHYIMYLPPIVDSIYGQRGVPWKGPEALIVVSDTKDANEIHKFCSIILGTDAVYLDLDTPSDKLSIKDPRFKECAILIVRLNRLANVMANGHFNNCKYVVIDGVHRLWQHERDSLADWLKTRKTYLQILTSKYYIEVFAKKSALVAIDSYIDGAVIAGMQFILSPFTKIEEINLVNYFGNHLYNSFPCVIISTNDQSKKDLKDHLQKCLPKEKFKCISFLTDHEARREKKGNFQILVHNGLPKSFAIFEHRFGLVKETTATAIPSGMKTLAKSIILINKEKEMLTAESEPIIEMLRDRNILPDPEQSLVKSARNTRKRLQRTSMKIEIVSVSTPEEYKIRSESNVLGIVRLADVSPKLKFGWDSSDSFRVSSMFLRNPFSDQKIEAYLYIDDGRLLAEDMLIYENGKTINLKKWLREQEIILDIEQSNKNAIYR